jgi:hypothetical protein
LIVAVKKPWPKTAQRRDEMVSPYGEIARKSVLSGEMKQVGIQFGCHLLARALLSGAARGISAQNLLDVQEPLVAGMKLGLHRRKVAAHLLDDL